eukprot:TRINITY_DN59192_c0_g1_i1.p1 TRINITY_DN59192_c0_g1~~TRINITY_DN59192_c0_g1_i1.p1  ORF type:complete len:111 (-),score=11.64 TRINITY_DN59192_c0_g1_i1:56-388(-)
MLFHLFFLFFFFQAEDGIRDAQESRGLGDVYKRQSSSKLCGGRSGFHKSGSAERVQLDRGLSQTERDPPHRFRPNPNPNLRSPALTRCTHNCSGVLECVHVLLVVQSNHT